MKKIVPIIIASLIFVVNAYSKTDTVNIKYGVYGGVNLNFHSAEFYKLDGIPNCCQGFENGDGLGFNAGILIDYRIAEKLFLAGRLGFMTLDGELIQEETTEIHTPEGPEQGIFEHRLTGKFFNLGFEPAVMYNPFGSFYVSGGMRFGINMTSDFDQIEEITKPEKYGTFMDENDNDTHSRTRNDISGEIPNAISFQMALQGGVSYELPLNRANTLRLVPELQYYLPLGELVSDTKWKVQSLRAGVAIKYAPSTSPEFEHIFKQETDIDTVEIPSDVYAEETYIEGKSISSVNTVEDGNTIIETELTTRIDTIYTPVKYALEGRISAYGVDDDGKEIPNPVFRIEEFVANRLDPLLNYLFFADGSTEIPERYSLLKEADTDKFCIDSLYNEETLDIYYQILNIIGRRMQKNANAAITITGCNSNTGVEKGNKTLSAARAENVARYLRDVWGIDGSRISVKSRNLPELASTPITQPEKIAENRRVEITSNNAKILEPIFISRIDRTSNPPIARFKAEGSAEAGLREWSIEAYQNAAPDDKFFASGKNTVKPQVDWKMESIQKIIPRAAEPVIFILNLTDKKNQEKQVKGSTQPIEVISVQKKRAMREGDFEIEKFSLILFGFDKSDIEGGNREIINMIKSRIKPGSQIEIKGYTDRTGDDDYNSRLSERRATSAKSALGRNDAQSVGIGEAELLYNNELPEGRFYCRTVVITVKTRVE